MWSEGVVPARLGLPKAKTRVGVPTTAMSFYVVLLFCVVLRPCLCYDRRTFIRLGQHSGQSSACQVDLCPFAELLPLQGREGLV